MLTKIEFDIVSRPIPRILKPTINILDITNIDEIDNSISILVDVSVAWNDSRLLLTAKNSSK